MDDRDSYHPRNPSEAYPSWAEKHAANPHDEANTAEAENAAPRSVGPAQSAATAQESPPMGETFPPQSSFQTDVRDETGSESPPHSDAKREKRRRVEKALRESLRWAVSRGMEAGAETFVRTDKVLRGVVDEVKVPKELASYLLTQIDETRSGVVRIAAKELRSFLEGTDLSGELRKLLTSISFEVRTQVRFVPNEAGEGLRSEVKTSLGPKSSNHSARKPAKEAAVASEHRAEEPIS